MKFVIALFVAVLSLASFSANASLIHMSDAPEYDFVVGDTTARVKNLQTNKTSRCTLMYNDNGIDKDNLVYVVSFFQCDAGFELMAKITTENGNIIVAMIRNGANKEFYRKYAPKGTWVVMN
ncbi:hypothetical protein 2050HW_00203 [Serratia phage vB_SmaM_ 2050HW]|uniref:Uncharacterized protein n=1 Tax=Serratia phage vB_SmaM_ 2050HW TaxID=2024252 RepID=A0A289ZTZ9_9CAUD|nr:hypothetical protein HWB23_gp203 [Serratia phage vB_SmaM_ 2050HW]ATA65538.1 hypothetical protein 2050HW_00203 [Serratia phage vB_SmaM_ 2050HW]UCR74794.1 hypothetical protein [Serratia phage BUCT660]UQT03663.1 hypothetical protein KODAMA_01960 [Serratia phage vB_SmaM-Kodama]URG14056.1 hypothetical protein [Pectobacterium phage vB_ParM-25]